MTTETILEALRQLKAAKDTREAMEQNLKDVTTLITDFEERLIPEMMMAMGLSEFTTAEGLKITLSKYYSAKIPAEKQAEAFAWLEENGFGGLIKSNYEVPFSRDDHERSKRFAETLDAAGVDYSLKEAVHPQTLKAWVKEQVESDKPVPTDLFGVYIGNTIKTKQK